MLIDAPSFITLTAVPKPSGQADIGCNLQVQANNPSWPVEVSNGSPQNPSTGVHREGDQPRPTAPALVRVALTLLL